MKRRFEILDVPDVTAWDEIKHLPRALAPVEFMTVPCRECEASCCNQTIPISGLEMLPIAFTLGVHPSSFVGAAPVHAHDTVRRPLPFKLDDAALGAGEFQLVLRRGPTGHCTFVFSPDGRTGRCGIWAVRPGNCRLYPFHVDIDDKRIKVGDERRCPVRWLQDDALRAAVERDARAWLAVLDEEAEIVRRWNRRRRGDRTLAAYLAYLVEEVAPDRGFDPRALDPRPPRRKLGRRLW